MLLPVFGNRQICDFNTVQLPDLSFSAVLSIFSFLVSNPMRLFFSESVQSVYERGRFKNIFNVTSAYVHKFRNQGLNSFVSR